MPKHFSGIILSSILKVWQAEEARELTCNRFGFFTLNFVQKKKRENGKK
jgi:hypothetical protein